MKKVLIVDDSPMIHKLLGKVLEENGYTVCGHAYNGKEGVDKFRELSPDIIFMDITMPVMDGLEAVGIIKKEAPHQNIIMLSAMGDKDIMDDARQLGVDIFLKKPFDAYKIISAISKLS
ncbi:MAG TPA: response regulator [Clostridiales bacterium]|nr:response regulator [Clostridiales bacterium]